MEKDKYVAFIPVRGGSKSIPLKNIRPICGRPLVYWTLDAAIQCQQISKVYLCTDSKEIEKCVSEYCNLYSCSQKLICIGRPEETATDTASTESVMLYFAQIYETFENIILIQATSPLLTNMDLSNAIDKYEEGAYDSFLSAVRQKRFCWRAEKDGYTPANYSYVNRPRRQEFNGFLVENGAFYINKRKSFLRDKCRLSGRIGIYEMPEETYFEIDELSDWIIVEELLKQRMFQNSQLKAHLKQVRMLLTDCDGVMTDGGMYYSEQGDELKKFNTRDGMAVQMLREHGIRFGIITGENSVLVRRRAEKLKADICYIGVTDKAALLSSICKKYELQPQEIAYIGDDRNDIGILQQVGVPLSVPDGADEVKKMATYITKARGGQGVIREIVELILQHACN